MAQQVQELIDKIKSEGVHSAQVKAREIEKDARDTAGNIVNDAKTQAKQILEEARKEAGKTMAATQMSLQQAARDMLLDLRRQIEKTLQKIVKSDIDSTLTGENLARFIETIIKNNGTENTIKVAVNAKDLEQLEKGFMVKLKNQLKKGISFESADDIHKGFTVSFDEGKSSFDFTEESLTEYLAKYLNDQVSQTLYSSVKSN
jgi:vacuolar-type H+-ATPase subunit E/Vma4